MTGLYGTTAGNWVYSPNRDTHDSIIHTADAVEEFGYIAPDKGGVVGSSEWTFIKPEDARAITQVPAMLALVDAVADWVNIEDVRDMARAIVKELEKK